MPDPAELTYHWVAADGSRNSGSERQLHVALQSGAVPATALVWRAGWTEWAPANRVRELSAAIREAERALSAQPNSALRAKAQPQAPAAPKPGPSRTPSLPKQAVAPSLAPSSDPAAASARDTLAPSSFGVIVPSRRPGELPAHSAAPTAPLAPARGRSPLPTLSEEQGVPSATATLRPPGAVPPPARGVPVPALDSSPRAATTPIPSFGGPGQLDAPQFNASRLGERSRRATPARGLQVDAQDLDATPASTARAEPSAPSPVAADSGPPSARPEPRRDSLLRIGRIGFDNRSVLMALSALSGALLVALLALWIGRGTNRAAPDLKASANALAAGPAPRAPAFGCRLALPAARIAPSIERSVPPYAASATSEGGVALGIAAAKTKGEGLHLDLGSLDVRAVFEEDGKEAVRGVVPLLRSGQLTFFVDRDDRALRSAHTLDAIPPFTVGMSDTGFARVSAGTSTLIWPLEAGAKITEPRSAEIRDFGYGVTFRRGGQGGAVVLGFLSSEGAKKSELADIPGAPKLLGTPVIAGNSDGVLIAFAGRDNAEAAWKLFVSASKPGAAPGEARALISAGGGGAISPTLAALPGGRWLVQWTEGSSAQYHVHVQSFAADLTPLGQTVSVSPKGANSGQGTLVALPSGALSLFILTTAGHDELWGATLACP